MIHYTVKTNNCYLLAVTLIKYRIPFEFRPTKMYLKRKWRNPYGASVFEIDLVKDGEISDPGVVNISIADILQDIASKPRGEGFSLDIIHQFEY